MLDTKSRHSKGVDHVVGGGDDAHLLIDRHHQRVVYLEQVVVNFLALLGAAIVGHLTMGGIERRDKTNAFAFALDVFITPLPLHAGGFDGQVRVGGVFGGHQHLGRRQSHADDDQKGNHRPGDFHRGGLMKVGRFVADRLAVLPDGIKHDAENGDKDHQADDHHEPVQPDLFGSDAGNRLRQIELVHCGATRQVFDDGQRRRAESEHGSESSEGGRSLTEQRQFGRRQNRSSLSHARPCGFACVHRHHFSEID